MSERRPVVAVVGAGVAGLAAAHALLGDGRVEVVVLEGSPRAGGKLQRAEIAGVPTDVGAEAILALRPEGLESLDALGLSAAVAHPVTTRAAIWSRGRLRSLPAGHVMGVPTSLRSLAASGVVSPAGVARAARDRVSPAAPLDGDISVGGFVSARLGSEVVDRLVEPLLGGVYAGRADRLSLRATLPAVAAVAGRRPLMRALRARPSPRPAGPVFAGLPGGVARLAEAFASVVSSGGSLRLGSTVRELSRTATGWRLVVGSAAAPGAVEADAVVVATPAAPASRLLASSVPAAATELATIDYASMAIVTLAYRLSALEKPLDGSGFLVPAIEGRLIKATTFSSVKWGWYHDEAPDLLVLRCSIGRYGEPAELQRSDDELIAGAVHDIADIAGVRGAPVDSMVTRWGGALPQYDVGHLDRVARVKAAVVSAPRLAVCGAAYDGVGIPACIGSGRRAAAHVLRGLFDEGKPAEGE